MANKMYNLAEDFNIDRSFADLLKSVKLDSKETGGAINFTGEDPVLPSKHKLCALMAFGMMGAAVATQILYRMRGGGGQDLSVDLRAAAAHINPLVAFKPSIGRYGYQLMFADPRENPISFGMYQTKDNRWYLPTGAYPHMIPDWIGLLECGLSYKAVTEAIAQWNAQELEDAAAARGMIGSICRTPEEWLAHEQGKLLSETPLIEIIKIGDSEPELPSLKDDQRPLSGLKVASFTHVIAGQVVGRTLAEQGAQILHLARPEYEYDALWCDTGLGFRSAWIDLASKDHVAKAREIVKGADVLVENFRGRKIAQFGFSAESVAEMRPGIIYTSIRAFGWEGPWAQRGGFDMDANCCTGFTVTEGSKDQPKLPPTVVLNDYLAGYLTAMGVLAALKLRAENGGSYHVRASLARYSMWYPTLGVLDPEYVSEKLKDPRQKIISPKGIEIDTAYGMISRLEPGITFSKTPSRWEVPGEKVVVPRGASRAQWADY
jgi:CoA-transferase family III